MATNVAENTCMCSAEKKFYTGFKEIMTEFVFMGQLSREIQNNKTEHE